MFDRFRAASQTQQIQLIIAGVCLIAMLLAAIWFFLLRVDYQPLFGDLRPADAATIVSALDRKKIPYRLADGGATILVPEDMVAATRLNVMTDDLPLKGTVGFELFNKSDMGLTDFAQKINYQRALQGELERTIMSLDGVDTARVHLSLGEDRLFRDDRVPPKASVTIRMRQGAHLSEDAAQGVKRLVAAAVADLSVADVVILDAQGDVVSAAPPPAPSGVTPALEEKRAVEEYYEARIREALQRLALPTSIAVNVQAETPSSAAATPGGLTGWSPGNRDFPLQVTLSPAAPLEAAAADGVRAAVTAAIASTAAQEDIVTFGTAPDAMPAAAIGPTPRIHALAITPALPDSVSPDEQHDLLLAAAFAVLLVLAVVLAIVLLARQLRGPRRLSEQRRQDFAAKLRTVLGERDGHAASRP